MGKVLDDNLTDKQAVFVTEYLRNGFNATQAAITAGFKPKTARQKGSQLLTKVNVQEVIKARLDTEGITADKIKVALAEIAFGGDLAVLEAYLEGGKSLASLKDEGVNTQLVKSAKTVTRITSNKDASKEYTTVSRSVDLYSRLDALEKLGKVLAMFTDQHVVTEKPADPLPPEDMEEFYRWKSQQAKGKA